MFDRVIEGFCGERGGRGSCGIPWSCNTGDLEGSWVVSTTYSLDFDGEWGSAAVSTDKGRCSCCCGAGEVFLTERRRSKNPVDSLGAWEEDECECKEKRFLLDRRGFSCSSGLSAGGGCCHDWSEGSASTMRGGAATAGGTTE